MSWKSFHHPGLSLPVIRRQATAALLDFIGSAGTAMITRGRSLTWGEGFQTPTAYRMAVSRLRKAGLIAYRRTGGREPVLRLTPEGDHARPEVCRPLPFWRRKWGGVWTLLSYDVPEKSRTYRDHLRGFLKRKRMGCLHQSLWISPDDLRADFEDLVKAAGLDQYAFLFEARNVLGRNDRETARRAWPFDELDRRHAWYLKVYAENFERLLARSHARDELRQLGREESSAYLAVMHDDPLLPLALCPATYRGPDVHQLHQQIVRAVAERL